MHDFLIHNIQIYDGTGAPPFWGSIAVENGKIVQASHHTAHTVIDGTGLCAAPGFIDAHTHSDFCLGSLYNSLSRVSQGITTQIAGQCGKSGVMRTREMYSELSGNLAPLPCPGYDDPALFETFAGYLTYVNHLPMVENTAFLIGHGNVRRMVMGYENRRPTAQEMGQMCDLLHQAMGSGALGLSSGLIYVPGVYSDMGEMVALCRVVARHGGIYATHLRNEDDTVLPAIDEALEVARQSGCRLNISHLKACGVSNHGRAGEMLSRIHTARREGLFVAVDHYPYAAGSTGLDCCIPPRHFADGPDMLLKKLSTPAIRAVIRDEMLNPQAEQDNTWLPSGGPQRILIADCPITHGAKGKTIARYAQELRKDPLDTLFDLLIDNGGDVLAVFFDMDERDVAAILSDPTVMVGCDSAAPAPGTAGHPRAFGSFPRLLGRFSRDAGLLPLEAMVHKMTGLPAQVFGLSSKGIIAPGMDADLVLFNAHTVLDRSDFTCPELLSDGIESVYIAGVCVYQDKRLTSARPGKAVLRGLSPT